MNILGIGQANFIYLPCMLILILNPLFDPIAVPSPLTVAFPRASSKWAVTLIIRSHAQPCFSNLISPKSPQEQGFRIYATKSAPDRPVLTVAENHAVPKIVRAELV